MNGEMDCSGLIDNKKIEMLNQLADKLFDRLKEEQKAAVNNTNDSPLKNLGLGYNEESVRFLAGYIQQVKQNGYKGIEDRRELKYAIGAFLGNCYFAAFGGKWDLVNGYRYPLALLGNGKHTDPIGTVLKQFRRGSAFPIHKQYKVLSVTSHGKDWDVAGGQKTYYGFNSSLNFGNNENSIA